MRRLWRRWESIVAALLFLCSVDVVVMPLMSLIGIAGVALFLVAVSAASAEVAYWYWYAGWLGRNLVKTEPVQRTAHDFTDRGFTGEFEGLWRGIREFGNDARDWLIEHATHKMAVDTPLKREMLDSALGIISTTHVWMMYPMMIGLGLMPYGWLFAILLCRAHRVRGAFVLFMLFNALKTYALGVAYVWLPLWFKLGAWLVMMSVVLWRVMVWRKKRRAGHNTETS